MMNTVPSLTPTSTDQQRQNIVSSTRAAISQNILHMHDDSDIFIALFFLLISKF
jgi:hypothetical protein